MGQQQLKLTLGRERFRVQKPTSPAAVSVQPQRASTVQSQPSVHTPHTASHLIAPAYSIARTVLERTPLRSPSRLHPTVQAEWSSAASLLGSMCSVAPLSPFVVACVSASGGAGDLCALLPSLLSALRASVVPSCASALPCWLPHTASALCGCCVRLSLRALSEGWPVEALASALSALLELHRTSHSQRAGLSDVSAYHSCRRHFIRLLAARSVELEPFARRVLSPVQCQSLVQCADSHYFPHLHRSQLICRRSAQLRCQPLDDRRAQQPDTSRLTALSEAIRVEAAQPASGASEASVASDAADISTTAPDGGCGPRRAEVVEATGDRATSANLSSAARLAVEAMRSEFSGRLQRLQSAVTAQ